MVYAPVQSAQRTKNKKDKTISRLSLELQDTVLYWIIFKLSSLLAVEHKTGMTAEDK